jgi:nucleoside 2-deoxyribosyltransferase
MSMKSAYLGIKYYADNSNKALIEQLSSALELAGYRSFCVARDLEQWGNVSLTPQKMMSLTFEQIEQADIVVLDMSEKGVGLGIEGGYAKALGKKLIITLDSKFELSTTMQGIADTVLTYDDASIIKFPV